MAAAVVVVPLSADRAPALSTFVSTLIDSLKYYTKRARREEIATYGPAQLATLRPVTHGRLCENHNYNLRRSWI